jgi:hypothetical protein
MAYTNLRRNPRVRRESSFLEGLGNKIKQGAEIAGALKGAWDIGQAIYGAASSVAPYIAPFVGIL